ncbi:uncharacterized protein FFB14_01369 [Fusarium fujikuroi]|nr:uncharacterized protein FFB14_01369 [Fusarium fujikuroi]
MSVANRSVDTFAEFFMILQRIRQQWREPKLHLQAASWTVRDIQMTNFVPVAKESMHDVPYIRPVPTSASSQPWTPVYHMGAEEPKDLITALSMNLDVNELDAGVHSAVDRKNVEGNRQRPSLPSIREWDVTVRVDLNINENISEQYRESDTKTDGFV